MSYIVTYVDEGKVDERGNPYLRAKADDGIHGYKNVMFPKTGRAKNNIPSRYDLSNVGIEIEVRDLSWAQTGRGGYYTVSESDIIGVVKSPQQNNQTNS